MANNEILTRNKKKQAIALLQGNCLEEAKSLLENICQINKNNIESWILLTQVYARLGRPEQVETSCCEIIRIKPDSQDAYYHLGCALMFQNKNEEAIEAFRRLLQLNPDHALTHLHMGNFSKNIGAALQYYQRAAQLQPNLAEAHAAVGTALVNCGRIDEAIASFRKGLQINPGLPGLHSNLLFALNYSPAYDAPAIFSEHVRWGGIFARLAAPLHANVPNAERRLRVGYVSPDFREHSVAYFLESLLANHSADEIETFCYAEVSRSDSTTERLRLLSGHWHNTVGINDRELAIRIRADGIDILVDLAGHSMNNRLSVFATKPAPVQVTYLGYPNTTGLTAIDYRLTDAWADPAGSADDYCTEKLVRLPHGFLCYQPPGELPPVVRPPVVSCRHITFGSFNNLSKVTPEVISVWASILRVVPDARLVIKNYSFSDPTVRERYWQLFAQHGINVDRLDFRARDTTIADHLNSYGAIDIALDTFPYNGATTTCEALWMGVPVITLAGRMHAGRVGVSLLSQVGLAELIAESPESYVAVARKLAENTDNLVHLRVAMREQLDHSPLCDGKNFAQDVELAYRSMWRAWCAGRQSSNRQ
ncbi:MAG: O-linked N-acetylglucosamine transferase, SPINDLY family protein [Sulfuricaulis sp.]